MSCSNNKNRPKCTLCKKSSCIDFDKCEKNGECDYNTCGQIVNVCKHCFDRLVIDVEYLKRQVGMSNMTLREEVEDLKWRLERTQDAIHDRGHN